jgi:hypothetical protein
MTDSTKYASEVAAAVKHLQDGVVEFKTYALICYVCGTISEESPMRGVAASTAYEQGWRVNPFGKPLCGECHRATV